MQSLKIKNANIEKLISFLDGPLSGSDSRARNRFVTLLGKQLVFLENERQRLVKEHSEKDEKGEPKLIENNTKYDITPENLEKASAELTALYNEDFVIDILPSNEKDVKVVSKILLETTKQFNLIDGATYDSVTKEFEEIK